MNQTLKSLLHSKTPIHYIGDVLLKFVRFYLCSNQFHDKIHHF